MPRKQKNKPKTSWLRRHFWRVFVAFVAIFGISTWVYLSGKTNTETTYVKLNTTTPIAQSFQNTNNAVFTSDADVPTINNNRTLNPVAPIILSYQWESGPYAPAFAMNINKNDLHKYIKISPHIRGNFEIMGPNALKFTPDAPWPADTRFTIRTSKKLFDADVRANEYTTTITTPKITATVDSFNTYHSRQTPQSMVAVAIISFNYAIDTDHFQDKISLKRDGEKLGFSVKFDRFNRTAFIISDPIPVTDAPQNIRLKINRISALNGNSSTKKLTASTTIAARDNLFRITDIESIVADDTENNSQQLILVRTSAPSASNLMQYTNAYLLPQYRNTDNTDTNHIWSNDEVTPDVIASAQKIKLTPTKFATPTGVYQYAFAYNIPDAGPRYIYLDIKSGAKSNGDFVMAHGIQTVVPVAYPEQTVKIAGTGAILNLNGDKKLGIMTRGGVHAAYINLSKIKSSEINHLISQTYNVFASDIEFKSWSFGTYDMSVVFQKRIPLNVKNAIETNYASIDLGDYMDRVANDKTGVFIIQVGTSENAANFSDRRLILVTNLGIIRKLNQDGTSDIFVSNLDTGTPATDIEIDVLGRNGNAIWSGRTDAAGHANIPALPWDEYKNAREPVAIVARNNNDISFIPYNSAYAQRVDYSKFDIDGAYSYSDTPLNAYVFTDRGIYRPGESVIIGAIIKNNSFKSLAGVPVRVEISDARGRTIVEKNISLQSDGLLDLTTPISSTAPIGEYDIRLYSLNVRAKPQDMLGHTTFQVAEFVPDTLKISANIAGASDDGWISTNAISATVNLRNLFGTPARNNRISARATLRPIQFKFDDFSQYTFDINNIYADSVSDTSPINTKTYTFDTDDIYTNDNGIANINVKFPDNILYGTYLLSLNINGYELNSGRAVQTTLTARASDAKYMVGYYSASDLKYINRNAERNVNLIALDHTAQPIIANDLTARVIRRETLTSLIKDYNNYYKYQTTTRDNMISQTNITIGENGLSLPINTETPGTYFLQIMDSAERILANIEYFVAGDENTSLATDTNADLSIKLDSDTYAPGDEISVNITAPYTGSGLITIERERVYAYKWFSAQTTSSTHKITIPSEFEGTGYINVSFVRDINSRDIFTSPYTYAVIPFKTNIDNRTIDIKLSAPKTIRDNKLTIDYETNKSGRIMLFAIDEGIIQVARHKIPNPINYFFQKYALNVETFQILSLLLPEYKILREFAKTGGGDYDGGAFEELSAALVNPFARRAAKPVAFYSGILNTNAHTPEQITFDIPDDFNGALKIFAVAANDNAIGANDITTTVQSPLIISMTAPTFVAPNDTFDVNAVITNLSNLGDVATIQTDAVVSDSLSLASNATKTSQIANDAQQLFVFNVRANNIPAASEITINAMALNDNGLPLLNRAMNATLSVRPITPFITDIKTGTIPKSEIKISDFQIDLYPEKSSRKIYVSNQPTVLARPLFEYLNNYEFPCTEQIVSRAMPYALMPHNAILGTNYDLSAKQISNAINTLRNRQNDNGSFALWASNQDGLSTTPDTVNLTAYVVNFLSLANENGFSIPDAMLGRAIDFLRQYATQTITDDASARALAYAIYNITQNGFVTTAYIDKFQEYANQNMRNWDTTISGAYIAASLEMMKQTTSATELIDRYRMSKSSKFKYNTTYENNVSDDAMYIHISNRFFNRPINDLGNAINGYINSGNYDAYTSARIIMALGGTPNGTVTANDITIASAQDNIKPTEIAGTLSAELPGDVNKIKITCASCVDTPLYYAIVQSGFTRHVADKSNGIEIVREYLDMDGNQITHANLGDIVNVKITARARGTNHLPNVAIVDLLPGGFVAEDISGDAEFSEIREDRVVIYTDLNRYEKSFSYRAQLTAGGTFAVPPIRAMSLYNAGIFGTDTNNAPAFHVINATND